MRGIRAISNTICGPNPTESWGIVFVMDVLFAKFIINKF